jgi:hypothetical protein
MTVMATERNKWQVAKRGFSFVVSGPIATAWEMAPQTAITTASVYMVAMFGMSHNILPWWIAVPMAAGFEWTWLRSIRTAGLVRKGKDTDFWINLLTWTALITVIAYGLLYIIGLPSVGIIPAEPGPGWGIVLALAKVIPIALMGFAAANLHRIHKQQVVADQAARDAENRARLTELQAQHDTIEIERQRKMMELDMWKQSLEVKRAMRVKPTAQPTRKKPVVIDGVEYESRAAAAQALGISPQAVSKRAKKD